MERDKLDEKRIFLFLAITFLITYVIEIVFIAPMAGSGDASRAMMAQSLIAAVMFVPAVSVALTVIVGHSGATAVWSGTGATPTSASPTTSASAQPSATGDASPSSSASASTQQSYTLAQVQQHNTASDCWAAINGGVYNLTDWISQHPGGPERITPLCGTDASAAFNGQHSGQSKPESTLTQFYIGELAS